MKDYTGKLNNHRKYLKVLNVLEKETKYIEIVLIDEKETNDLVEKFKQDIISTEFVSSWWGTETEAKNKLVKINASKELFEYLKQFETFCKYKSSLLRGDYSEITNFGDDDIAFYDENDEILLCTTTHEGYIMINDKL